jgi:hypothetical protein
VSDDTEETAPADLDVLPDAAGDAETPLDEELAPVTLKSVPDLEEAAPAPKPRTRTTKTKRLGKTLAAKRRTTKTTGAATDTAPDTQADTQVDTAPENQTTRSVETVEEHAVPASLQERVHTPAAHADEPFQDEVTGLVLSDLDERPPTIEEIARLVVERMHDAELAMMRHLEAVEAEAARRCELVTAQAELDAELIRLNARREAHHIVTDARLRAEGRVGRTPEQEQLDDLTESLTRFADVVDELRPAATRSRAGRTP